MKSPDYNKKIWGTSRVRLAPRYLQALKLRYCLRDLETVRSRLSTNTRPMWLLDIGCGGGGITKAIKHYRPDLEISGCDVSQKAIAAASRNPQGVSFSICEAEQLPFRDNFFDALTLFDVLEHVEDPKQLLTEARRVLKKGGLLHLSSPLEGQPGTLYWVLEKFGWRKKEKLAGHLHQFSVQSLLKLVEAGDFKIFTKYYSSHLLGQALDILFYTSLAGKLDRGLEEKIAHQRGLKRLALNSGKNVLVGLSNMESLISQRLIGGCVHLTARAI